MNIKPIFLKEIFFKSGLKRQRFDERYDYDPQSPSASMGEIEKIKLIPVDNKSPEFEVLIPGGTKPVLTRFIDREYPSGKICSVQYLIGWNKGGIRNFIAYDPDLNRVYLKCDTDGLK